MVITVLAGDVSKEKWSMLQKSYRELDKGQPNAPSESFLVQDKDNPNTWKIISVWKDMQALKKVKNSGKTPKGVVLFNEVGVEPSLSVLDVKEVFK